MKKATYFLNILEFLKTLQTNVTSLCLGKCTCKFDINWFSLSKTGLGTHLQYITKYRYRRGVWVTCFKAWVQIIPLTGKVFVKLTLSVNMQKHYPILNYWGWGMWISHFNTEKNAVISPNFLVWKFCGKAQISQHSGDSPKVPRKLCISTNFRRQIIRWNYGLFCSVTGSVYPRKLKWEKCRTEFL